jgi:uncharacterized protein (DUF952 family)
MSGWTTARIVHVAERAAWERAQHDGAYRAASLDTEGFIHCSTPWQVGRVADALFAGRDDLVLLVIDPSRLESEPVFENCEGGIEPFPHVYGDVPVNAVVDVHGLRWNQEVAAFELPAGYR